jgi:hypothetical protein
MAITASLGINSFSSGIITKVTTSQKVETKVLKKYDGSFSTAAAIDPTAEFSVEGSGDYPSVTIGVATSLLPGTISGGVIIIDSYSQTEKNTEFQSWKYSGKQYPGAS